MQNFVWAFNPPSMTASLDVHRIAMFISQTLRMPILHPKDTQGIRPKEVDTIIFCGFPSLFTGGLEYAAQLGRFAKRVVFVHTDYQAKMPKATSKGLSPWRAAWRNRAKAGLSAPDVWSSIYSMARTTPHSAHLNWNATAYGPTLLHPDPVGNGNLIYYGSWRAKRIITFDNYFNVPLFPTVISGGDNFTDRYISPGIVFRKQISRTDLSFYLNTFGLGLYLEDSNRPPGDQSPANRFYEMLTAGLPMIFQPETVPGLLQLGFDATSYSWNNNDCALDIMRCRKEVAREQRKAWAQVDYREELRVALLQTWKEYNK